SAAPDGRVWILTPEQASAFTPGEVEPVHTADGTGVQVTVTTAGTVLMLDGDQLLRFPRAVDTAEPVREEPITLEGLSTSEGSVALTAVGEQPVVLDRAHRLLRIGTDDRPVDLADAGIADAASVVLQQPSDATEHVVLASADSLIQVPLDGGAPVVHAAGGTGTPAA